MPNALEHLRFPIEKSRGRRYPEPPHPYRNDYQRDRDRVIHSHAFRRLENKTQVFTSPASDHFRNRLTHTIEVSQIARTVAVALGLNEDLVEALALAHDIGHPPFGHSGEARLDAEMRRFGDRFDHNLHALRIVEVFEHRYAAFPGLNLTFEVREGIIKHSRDYNPAEFPELAEYSLDRRPPLEAQLIDPADEITYDCADLDDAVDAGLLAPESARGEVPLFNRLWEQAAQECAGATERQKFNQALRHTLDALVSGLIEGTRDAAGTAGLRSVEEVRAHPRRLAVLTAETREAGRQLKAFLYAHVYTAPPLAEEKERSAEKLADLFRFYLRSPDQLPAAYHARAETEPLHRVVCDYIAGMTDGYLLRLHGAEIEKLKG
ncbi:MAG TPA: dNTP triphosphohydrolase [Bryobacterales bacterium]|nr:dNTP triphosphohydrolase [Bryobacterales bacterium]